MSASETPGRAVHLHAAQPCISKMTEFPASKSATRLRTHTDKHLRRHVSLLKGSDNGSAK